jgi:hypothetical protein
MEKERKKTKNHNFHHSEGVSNYSDIINIESIVGGEGEKKKTFFLC